MQSLFFCHDPARKEGPVCVCLAGLGRMLETVFIFPKASKRETKNVH